MHDCHVGVQRRKAHFCLLFEINSQVVNCLRCWERAQYSIYIEVVSTELIRYWAPSTEQIYNAKTKHLFHSHPPPSLPLPHPQCSIKELLHVATEVNWQQLRTSHLQSSLPHTNFLITSSLSNY